MTVTTQSLLALALFSVCEAASYRTIGSSGCAAQMVFVPPYTDTVVFLDNYHRNFGGPGVDLKTGTHSKDPFIQDNGLWAFGVEYEWRTNDLRKLTPKSNTFCAAGAFAPDGTLINVAGAELYSGDAKTTNLQDGRQTVRRYKPGPCDIDGCKMDFEVNTNELQSRRWYPTSITLTNGDVLVVGGSDVGLLVTNEASINNPTYELIKADGSQAPPQKNLTILEFGAEDNQNADMSFNLYPILQLLPNADKADHVFTLAGNRANVYNYATDEIVKELPNIPGGPRTFPGSAAAVLLPLKAPENEPTILVCGGSSADIPNPKALGDCYRIKPNDQNAVWIRDDWLPNGGQTMIEPVLLPDGTIVMMNGAHRGSAGGYQAEDPALQALIYDPNAPKGQRFTKSATSEIPRMYHSVAILLPTGEVLVAGSNPDVFYNPVGNVSLANPKWPEFQNNGHKSYLHQQQEPDTAYPTEYRVEIYAPPYMDKVNSRPFITAYPISVKYGEHFKMAAEGAREDVVVRLSYSGFHTHGVDMGARMVQLDAVLSTDGDYIIDVTAPADASVMPPGVYMLWVIEKGIPSEAVWMKLEA
ncbi:hypothetical protein D6C98_07109 [Aureobasidium pullulans]|uniref:Glyoxal oxidase n=1 Tax=Aureobasidium pullulans TaxID=5580 RepID=A0A4S8WA94_AURPU|nr:hypothetical protein D6D24_01586 [Aureobasidium pullulans]THY06572.1 hypothetical protein D6D03_02296 [Aureobasidium pullulans]THY47428.1 hypothetical protein D6C98_07109 [Aureobasidium pullulans]THZ22581.1 hypothetical protein D6C89_05992 [Aureobasidium pullulans]